MACAFATLNSAALPVSGSPFACKLVESALTKIGGWEVFEHRQEWLCHRNLAQVDDRSKALLHPREYMRTTEPLR